MHFYPIVSARSFGNNASKGEVIYAFVLMSWNIITIQEGGYYDEHCGEDTETRRGAY